MTSLEGILLGAIQGLTEFLPVSSSAHLVFAKSFLGLDTPGASLEVTLHLGTLLSVIVFFRKDILEILRYIFRVGARDATNSKVGRDMLAGMVLGTLPAALLGFLFKSDLERAFSSPEFASIALLATGAFLLLTRLRLSVGREARTLDWLYVGVAQAAAILPGISRSGATIGTGILMGLRRDAAARVSFLLSIPAIAGASVVELPLIAKAGTVNPVHLVISAISSFAFGCLSVWTVFRIVRRGAFEYFGIYCLAVGFLASVYFIF